MTKLGFCIALVVIFAYVAVVNSTRKIEELTAEHLERGKRQADEGEEPSLFYIVSSGCHNILIFIVDFSFALDGGTMEIFAYKQGEQPAVPEIITKNQMPKVTTVVAFYALFSEFSPCDTVVFNLTLTDVNGHQTPAIISQQMGCPCLPIDVDEDPHVKCCDGNRLDLQGPCKYLLIKDIDNEFEVYVQNDELTVNHGRRYLQVTEIMPAGVLMFQNHTIQLGDGTWMSEDLYLPSHNNPNYALFKDDGMNVLCWMQLGHKARVDMFGHNLESAIMGEEIGRTCGLCGNCNGDPTDDNKLCDGSVPGSFDEFVAANTISCENE